MRGFHGDASNEWQTQGDVPRCGQGRGRGWEEWAHLVLWTLVVASSLVPSDSVSLWVDPSWTEVLGAGRGMWEVVSSEHGGQGSSLCCHSGHSHCSDLHVLFMFTTLSQRVRGDHPPAAQSWDSRTQSWPSCHPTHTPATRRHQLFLQRAAPASLRRWSLGEWPGSLMGARIP